jgi:pheganomycin biosynthesis PGM1-like protein
MDPSATARFDKLQTRLVHLWKMIGQPDQPGSEHQQAGNTIVVIPSMSIDTDFKGMEQQAYEERFLFMLFLLRQPNIRLVYITSQPIQPSIIDYYLSILPGVVTGNARKRLFLVSPLDASARPLSAKLLERPRLIENIKSLIQDPQLAHIVPYNTTDLERELSVQLGIPMYAADPRFFGLGTKSGGRRIFAEENVPHPAGSENLTGEADLLAAIAKMRLENPVLRRVMVKLNEGVSGEGNAVVDLGGLGEGEPAQALAERVRNMRFEMAGATYPYFLAKLGERGGIAEEFVTGDELLSPSVQLRVSPLGEVQVLSTHDQMLGGPGGQSYLGAKFPAHPDYSRLIVTEALKVGKRLAKEGVIGRFALDFVVARSKGGEWQPYAIEINLRKGGTTHPFLALQYLTDGVYDWEKGIFRTLLGHPKHYVATDHLESPEYRVFSPDDLFDIVSRHRLHFDHLSQRGIVLHMISNIGTGGRFGLTAVADTAELADALYKHTVQIFDDEARAAHPN